MTDCADRALLFHCAPTLAGMKSGSLFCIKGNAQQAVAHWNEQLGARGVGWAVVRQRADSALIYVYRKRLLLDEWKKPGVESFLRQHGYDMRANVEDNIARLAQRISTHALFPHEIGLFLGYPLEDVRGFILNSGRDYIACGCWKVYSNETAALRCFAKYKKCQTVYLKCYQNGHSLARLTVAA